MQLRSSLKQLWIESKANPGFTILYVGGVAFTVTFTMVIAMIFYVHVAPVYPEYNRGTTSYISSATIQKESDGMMMMSNIGRPFVEEYMEKSKNLEFYTLSIAYANNTALIQPINGEDFKANIRYTDPNFFKLYDYEFLEGHPFSQADYDAGIRSVVVSNKIANRLFGSTSEAIGKEISIDFAPNRIVGVMREGSPLCFDSYAQVAAPLTVLPENPSGGDNYQYLFGNLKAAIKFKDKAQADAFNDELNEMLRRTTASDTTGWKLSHNLRSHAAKTLFSSDKSNDISEAIRPMLLILFVLLLIPAINISGMIGGQMDRRVAEIGVRRSFGATRGQLTRQVMFENLTLTLIGGAIGLIGAWLTVAFCRKWILNLIVDSWEWDEMGVSSGIELTGEMIFAPTLFLIMIGICLVLNLLSAYIPIRLSLRRQIVNSINQKR